jgi:hypothetical protein
MPSETFWYNDRNWTILEIKNNSFSALCTETIAKHQYDSETNIWEKSGLKTWLETEGLQLIAG